MVYKLEKSKFSLRKKSKISKVFIVSLLLVLLLILNVRGVLAEDGHVKIGVLAKRGSNICMERWSPTVQYLTSELDGYSFEIVPLDFEEVFTAVENKEVDFILVNNALYVDLEVNYGVSRIATLKNRGRIKAYTIFGGVIFCRSDLCDIKSLNDLRGKSFMAVDEISFGGWIMAWRELNAIGINPYNDFTSLQFGGTHDAVVYAVRDGEVDAGTVRTDTLERMAAEGKINISEFYIINRQVTENFLFAHSTQLYPEWPFAKVRHTSDDLAEKVTIALLSMSPDDPAAIIGKFAGWTIPLNYEPVHECLKDLSISPYEGFGEISFMDIFERYWYWIILAVIILFFMFIITVYVINLNRKLNLSKLELKQNKGAIEVINKNLKKANTELKVLDIAKTEFLSCASHELKSPLVPVSGYLQMFLHGEMGKLTEEQKRILNICNRNIEDLAYVMNNMLDLSKLELKKIVLDKKKIDMTELAKEIKENFEVMAQKKHVDLQMEVPKSLVVFADRARISQVLSNLVKNALHYAPGTERDIKKVVIGVSEGATTVRVSVIDEGPGISREDQAKLFNKFFRAKKAVVTSTGGSGLGLCISKGFIQLHGGIMTVKSEVGKGSAFSFTIPKGGGNNGKNNPRSGR